MRIYSWKNLPAAIIVLMGRLNDRYSQCMGQIRTLRSAFETRVNGTLGVAVHVAPWMIRHAPSLVNWLHVGKYGNTPYSRVRGKRFSREIHEFGERILYLIPESVGTNKYDPRWEHGIWL